MADIAWKPFLGFQTKFLQRGEFEAFAGGAAGPGKTDCLIAKALAHVDHPKYHGLILRRTFPRLQEILDRCHELYPLYGGSWRSKTNRFEFPSGARITLGHCQHEESKRDYHGKEFQYIAFDELTEFTQSQYEFIALSRARSTVPEIPIRIRSASNPGGIGHAWVKERFIDVASPGRRYIDPRTGLSRIYIPGTVEDNPALFYEGSPYTAQLEALPEIERKRLRYGIWDAFEGQAFPELSQLVHGCEPFEVSPEWTHYCVLDWGYSKPFCVLWAAVDYDEVIYVYKEWYGCKKEQDGLHEGADVGLKMTAAEVAQGILEREEDERKRGVRILRYADPSIHDKRPSSRKRESRGETIADDMSSEGLYFLKADNDRDQGRQQVHKRLKLDEDVDEETGELLGEIPRVQIFNTCKGFWRTMPTLIESERNPEDIDTKQEDHVYDTFRYLCMARPMAPAPKKVGPSPGSFQAERARLIRAKKMSRIRGIPLTQAYSRVR